MKIEKKKVVFGSILLGVILFIVAYSVYVFGDDSTAPVELSRPMVPPLQEKETQFKSRTEAIENLQEDRPRKLPDLYDEKVVEEDYSDAQQSDKKRMLDSVLNDNHRSKEFIEVSSNYDSLIDDPTNSPQRVTGYKQVDLNSDRNKHQDFFLYNPDLFKIAPVEGSEIFVEVSGDQEVRNNDRLELKLTEDSFLHGVLLPRNTRFYATVKLQPNRLVLQVEGIRKIDANLEVFDMQDGKAGIYIENSLLQGVTTKVIDDIVDGIEVPGVPQVKGISSIFRKDNRKIKVAVVDHYKLILKPKS